MYSIINEHDKTVAMTDDLEIATAISSAFVLTEDYFDDLDRDELEHAALEWIVEY